ncbi:MAG: RDD family protein [Pseudomonadota bacterium]
MENSTPLVVTPSLKRRLISMVYEFLLLTAVEIFIVGVYTLVTLNLHSALLDGGRNIVVVLAAAAYFVYSWSGSGHTLAMKTWRIKLVKVGYPTVPPRAAALRFVYAWGAIAPALIIIHLMKLMTSSAGTRMALAILGANIVLWAMTAFLDKDRQFLHDKLAGTRLIELPKRAKK